MNATHPSADPAVFVEHGEREAGLGDIWARMIAPEMAFEAQRWRQAHARKRRHRLRGDAIMIAAPLLALVLAWSGATAWWLAPAVAAGGIWLGLRLRRSRRVDGRRLRTLLIAAACEHLGGLTYQRVAARRVEFDHHVELALVPRYGVALVEDFFAGNHRGQNFRMVEAQLRDGGRRVFHGLLVEIDLELGLTGSITVRHCRNDDRSALPGTGNLAHVPGSPVVLKSDPMFHRRFDIFADDEASARELLGSRFRAALMHLADRWGATPWQAGHAWGKLMIAMPGEGDPFEPRSVATGTFDPAGDLRLLLEELSLPYRIIDTFAGIDPDTGRRLRA